MTCNYLQDLKNNVFFLRCIYFYFQPIRPTFFSDIFIVSNSFDLKNTKKRYLHKKNIYFRSNWTTKKKYIQLDKRREDAIVSV